jgi:antitoxin ParD1/3/4
MSIELDQETEQLIERELETGQFHDAATLVGAALRHYVLSRKLTEDYSRDETEAKIARGIASLERGEGVDGETFLSELVSNLSAREPKPRG